MYTDSNAQPSYIGAIFTKQTIDHAIQCEGGGEVTVSVSDNCIVYSYLFSQVIVQNAMTQTHYVLNYNTSQAKYHTQVSTCKLAVVCL